jgi:hypothetical protein
MERPHKYDIFVHIKGEQVIRHFIIATNETEPGEIDYQMNEVYLPPYLDTLRKMPGFKSETEDPIEKSAAPFAVLPGLVKHETFWFHLTRDFFQEKSMSLMDVMRATNFPFLRAQKKSLLGLLEKEITREETMSIKGLIEWIDSIQDAAVDVDKIARAEDVYLQEDE